MRAFSEVITELVSDDLLTQEAGVIRLTSRGRLLSNEVFARFIATAERWVLPAILAGFCDSAV